jgi:hypothetical protein
MEAALPKSYRAPEYGILLQRNRLVIQLKKEIYWENKRC